MKSLTHEMTENSNNLVSFLFILEGLMKSLKFHMNIPRRTMSRL